MRRNGWMLALATIWLAGTVQAAGLPEMPAEFAATAAEVRAAAEEVTPERYPDADFVIVDQRSHTRYEADGSDVSWSDEWVKVLTERGRRALAKNSTWEQLRYGDAEIQEVEIVDATGGVRKIDFRLTLKETTDNSAAGSNIYDPLDKELTCAVPTLAVGEIRHVREAHRTLKPRMAGAWYDYNQFEARWPSVREVVTVDAPAALPVKSVDLARTGTNDIARAADERRGDRVLSRWEARNVPQYFEEPRMPEAPACVATLRVSTVGTWEEVSKWYWSMCEGHLAKTNAAMAAKVRELVGERQGEDAIRAIFRFVSQDVRYMGLTLEDTAPGYEPHDVDLTFSRLYGVCRDKAALLVALLRLGGFEAYPVLINAGAKVEPKVPMPGFNHAIVAVATDGGYLYMDPTNESTRELLPSYLSEKSCVVARPEGDTLRLTPTPPVEDNLLSVETKVRLAADCSATLEAVVDFRGISDTAFRSYLIGKSPKELHNEVETLIRGGDGVEELEVRGVEIEPHDLRDTETPLRMTVRGHMPSIVRRGVSTETLRVPYVAGSINFADLFLKPAFALERRRFPIRFFTTAGTREHVVIDYRSALGKLVSRPEPFERGDAEGGYVLRRRVTEGEGRVEVTREELLTRLEIPAERYREVRELRESAETEERGELCFARDPDREAELHFHREAKVYHFTAPNVFVCTNLIEVTILNKDGRKRLAEAKLDCNDHLDARIVGATVEKDGRTATLAPEETNDFDADWMAAAPRYPRGVRRVVTMPKVEIGSRMTVVTEYVEKGDPLPFARLERFYAEDACDGKSIELWMPKEMERNFRHEVRRGESIDCRLTREEIGDRVRIRYEFGAREGLGKEKDRPKAERFCPYLLLKAGGSGDFFAELDRALVAVRGGAAVARAKARELTEGIAEPERKIDAIRVWICRNIRTVAVADLVDNRPAEQVSDPDRAIADGYASILDRANLYATMLEAVGMEARIVFSAGRRDRWEREFLLDCDMAGPYSAPVVIATVREGMWPFGKGRDFLVDPEATEFAIVGTSRHECDWACDPKTGKRFELPAMEERFRQRETMRRRFLLREQGAIDIDEEQAIYGGDVGYLRRAFREMRPEIRRRYQLKVATGFARNATVTREMETDVEGYPFRRTISVYAEKFATVQNGVMTVKVPGGIRAYIPMLPSMLRACPILIGQKDLEECEDEIVFPEGWTEVEFLPESWQWRLPGEEELLAERCVTTRIREDGRLAVTIRSRVEIDADRVLPADFAGYLTAVGERRNAAGPVTISVRRR